ncbi:hypothetical protein JB92DRAFT_2838458 [Gautieria morchelliformis]|nr:hypothetical protein JB92DRAFT_2838458 [Gautieria morchelliformis]
MWDEASHVITWAGKYSSSGPRAHNAQYLEMVPPPQTVGMEPGLMYDGRQMNGVWPVGLAIHEPSVVPFGYGVLQCQQLSAMRQSETTQRRDTNLINMPVCGHILAQAIIYTNHHSLRVNGYQYPMLFSGNERGEEKSSIIKYIALKGVQVSWVIDQGYNQDVHQVPKICQMGVMEPISEDSVKYPKTGGSTCIDIQCVEVQVAVEHRFREFGLQAQGLQFGGIQGVDAIDGKV